MKKLIQITVLAALCSFIMPQISEASCNNFCTDPWQTKTIVEQHNFCSMVITYKYRECPAPSPPPDFYREMELVSAKMVGECPFSGDTKFVTELAIRFMLNQAYKDFPTLENDPNQDVYTFSPCCMEVDANDELNSCEEVDCCCRGKFTLSRQEDPDGNGYIVTTWPGVDQSTGTVGNGNCPSGCSYACEVVELIQGGVPDYGTLPCKECESTNYSTGGTSEKIINSGNCEITVNYSYRKCDGDVIFNITSFTYEGVDCSNDELLWNEAIEGILADLASQFSLPETFKFNYSTCWKRETTNGLNYFAPCVIDDCCLASYDVITGPEVETYDLQTQFTNCSTLVNCDFKCNDDHAEISGSFGKKAPKIEGNLFETNTEVIPNPTNGKVEFNLESRYDGNIEFGIYTQSGKEIYSTSINKSTNSITINYDAKDLAKGIYYFRIKAGTKTIDSGKFVKE